MRKKRDVMIEYIQRATGCEGCWDAWDTEDVRCIYVFIKIGAPNYFEASTDVERGNG